MGRFIDQLLAAKQIRDIEVSSFDVQSLRGAVVFRIQNISDYHFSEKKSSYQWTDFPNAAPPYPLMWLEYRSPATLWADSGKYMELAKELAHSVNGIAIQAKRFTEAWEVRRTFEVFPLLMKMKPSTLEPPFWLLSVQQFLTRDLEPGTVPAWMGTMYLQVNNEGIISSEHNLCIVPMEDAPTKLITDGMQATLRPAILAISFMHCKNVTIEKRDTPPKAQERRVKEGKPPLVSFHELNIRPMQRVLREAGSEKTGLTMALHVCRGHFKTFTPEHPLFGKAVGTYWWESQLRGTKEKGIRTKDYVVGPPPPRQQQAPLDF